MCTRIRNAMASKDERYIYNLKCGIRFSFYAVRTRGGVVNKTISISVAKTLIKQYLEMNLNYFDLDGSSWLQSLFRRMNFVRRFTTTGKVHIPEALRKELEKAYLHSIVWKIEGNDIPLSLIFKLDQTPSKYIPGSNKTMTAKGSKNVPLKGSTNKRIITATFTISLFCSWSLYMQVKQRNASQESSFLHPFHLASNQSTTAMKKSQLKY